MFQNSNEKKYPGIKTSLATSLLNKEDKEKPPVIAADKVTSSFLTRTIATTLIQLGWPTGNNAVTKTAPPSK